MALLQQNDEQREHFRENRDAFEQEERQVHGAGELRHRARLAGNSFRESGCQSTNTESGTDDG
jgi:hypothetical protein